MCPPNSPPNSPNRRSADNTPSAVSSPADDYAPLRALDLYSNYFQSPENIDVFWTNDLGFTIIKNLSLNIVTQLFYDDDVNVQVDLDGDGIYGEPAADVNLPPGQQRDELMPSVSWMQGIFLKYNLIF